MTEDFVWTPLQQFFTQVKSDECWHWTGEITESGYGRFHNQEQRYKAHRYVYELLVGPIPDNLPLDHTCHNADLTCPGGSSCLHRRCVNPNHLEPVTNEENQRRARGRSSRRKGTCIHGHEFTAENTILRANGWRGCRACHRAHNRRNYMQHRDKIRRRKKERRQRQKTTVPAASGKTSTGPEGQGEGPDGPVDSPTTESGRNAG